MSNNWIEGYTNDDDGQYGIVRGPNHLRPVGNTPDLESVLSEVGPLPSEALFLGMASDGLPVLLNLHDPVPGPILITGDTGTRKTDFLKMIASSAGKMHRAEDVQFGIITAHPEEWDDLERTSNNVGVFPSFDQSSEDFILSLASWAHGNKTSRQSVVLLFDDLQRVEAMSFDAQQNLRWLLLRGPARKVWTIMTANSYVAENNNAWLDSFHTRVLGNIQSEIAVHNLDAASATPSALNDSNFTMREGDHWLNFWIPSL